MSAVRAPAGAALQPERPAPVMTGAAVVWWALAVSLAGAAPGWATAALGVVTLFTLPGAALLALGGVTGVNRSTRVVLSVALSTVVVMVVGGLLSLLHPLGVARPLGPGPVTIAWVVLGGVLAGVSSLARRDAAGYLLGGLGGRTVAGLAAAAVLPLGAVAGAARVNNDGATGLALALTAVSVAGMLALCALAFRRRDAVGAVAIGLYSITVTLLLLWTLRGYQVFGWDIQQELGVARWRVAQGRFVPSGDGDAYSAMLSLSVVPAQLKALFGISVGDCLRVVMPFVGALTPVAVLVMTARRASLWLSVGLTGWLVLGSVTFLHQLPSIVRQEMAFVLLGGALIALTEERMPMGARRVLVAVLAGGLAFTHYTTAYLVTVLLLVGAVVGWAATRRSGVRGGVGRGRRVLLAPVVVVVVVCAAGWNFGINNAQSVFESPARQVDREGLALLPDQGPLVERWLAGASSRLVSGERYGRIVEAETEPGGKIAWVRPDSGARREPLRNAVAPTKPGALLRGAAGYWALLQTLVNQLVLVVLVGGIAYAIVLRRRGGDGALSVEYLAVAVAAVALAALMRTSGTGAAVFNPERGALLAALVLAAPAAQGVAAFGRALRSRARTLGGVVAFVLLGSMVVSLSSVLGLASWALGGVPSAAFATTGEQVERFVISAAEVRTASWIDRQVCRGDLTLLNTDRYGALVFLGRGPGFDCQKVSDLVPVAVDRNAFVYLSRANLLGRARGADAGVYAVYVTPRRFLDGVPRSVVYATDSTRVYR